MGPKFCSTRAYTSICVWQALHGEYISRASDCRISLSHADSDVIPSGDLQAMTFTAIGVDRSTGGPRSSWHTMSSWISLPRFTIDVLLVSDADHRNAGWVKSPARPCAAGQVPA